MKLPKAFTTVPPTHNITAPYVGVGEQPNYQDVKKRKMFDGAVGRELDEDLAAADLSRPLIYLTNVIKDKDKYKEHYIQLYKNKTLLKEPIISERGIEYLKFLQWELAQTKAVYFIAFGGIALFALTERTGIQKWRGSVLDCTLVPGRKVIPILHPATVVPPQNQFLNKRLIIFDLKRVREYTEKLHVPTKRSVVIEPSFKQVLDFLSFCKTKGLNGSRISYDIEVYMNRVHKQVSCIAFAINKQSICIPFADGKGDYFSIQQEVDIWKKIAEILEHPKIKICGQNLVFDNHFLLRTYGIVTTNIDDTMVAQNILMSDFPKGLDFITSVWTDHPYYKADGKAFFSGHGVYQKFWQYNASDAHICDEAFPKQREEITKLGSLAAYQRQVKIIEPLVYMMERGIKVNVKLMEQEGRAYKQKIEEFQDELNQLAGKPLNAKSPKQLKEYFLEEKGIKPYKKAGKITYNDDAMKRLIRKGFHEAKLIQQIRKYTKLRSTYLDINKIDEDGRIRCSYNPAGTRYSRISSSKSIWGTGNNMQNFPHHIQKFLVPDKGYVYYAFDLSQAENRIVAYVGEVIDMIECFETGADVHAKTARIIMKTFFGEEKAKQISVEELAPVGDGSHKWRDWGKKANHGFNYDWGFKNFALANEIPENEGKFIYTAYHNLYPGVQQSYHTYIKACLRSSRILTNLMKRKTLFLGPIIGEKANETFKEAYSCIPQGTVGDMVNEYGLNYIYYNQNIFRPVELLRQVHDEIGFQIPLSLPWSDHVKLLTLIKKKLETPLTTHNGRTFIIPADLTMGIHLDKNNGYEVDFSNALEAELQKGWRTLNEL